MAQEKLKKQLGEKLSKKYNDLNIKNCECSLYGFVTNHGILRSKDSLEKLCDDLMVNCMESSGASIKDFKKRVYVLQSSKEVNKFW